jgi:hypothetical protein
MMECNAELSGKRKDWLGLCRSISGITVATLGNLGHLDY